MKTKKYTTILFALTIALLLIFIILHVNGEKDISYKLPKDIAAKIAADKNLLETYTYFFTSKKVPFERSLQDLDVFIAVILNDIRPKIRKDIEELAIAKNKIVFKGYSEYGPRIVFEIAEDSENITKGPPSHGPGSLDITIIPLARHRPGRLQFCSRLRLAPLTGGSAPRDKEDRFSDLEMLEVRTYVSMFINSVDADSYGGIIEQIVDKNLSCLFDLAERANSEHLIAAYLQESKKECLDSIAVNALIKFNYPKAEELFLSHLSGLRKNNNISIIAFWAIHDGACTDIILYLEEIKSKKAVPLLLDIAERSHHLGHYAFRALGKIKDYQVIPKLIEFANSSDEHLHVGTLQTLVAFDDSRAIETVLSKVEKHAFPIVEAAIHVKPLSEGYVPMLEQILSDTQNLEFRYIRDRVPWYPFWALANTGSPRAKELLLDAARKGNTDAIGFLGNFPDELTADYLISILYEKVLNGNGSKQGAAEMALAQMPEMAVPRLLKMLETETGQPFSSALDVMHALFEKTCREKDKAKKKAKKYSFVNENDNNNKITCLYPDDQYKYSRHSFEIRQAIAKIWKDWWNTQSSKKKY